MAHDATSKTLAVLANTKNIFCNEEIIVRAVHSWESRNHKKGMNLMGQELLLLDAEGFIPASRLSELAHLVRHGKAYIIQRFMIKPSRDKYKVTGHKDTIVFTDQTIITEFREGARFIPEQMFRLLVFRDFSAIVDTEIVLFGYWKFQIHVKEDNLNASRQTFTVSQICETDNENGTSGNKDSLEKDLATKRHGVDLTTYYEENGGKKAGKRSCTCTCYRTASMLST